MANLDSSPTPFIGQPWSLWEESTQIANSKDDDVTDGAGKDEDDGDTMKLRVEDMTLFGMCPAQDEFYLVVCEKCGQAIKPQALKTHLEQRHSQITSPKGSTKHGSCTTTRSPGRKSQHSPKAGSQKQSARVNLNKTLEHMTRSKRNHTMASVSVCVERMPSPAVPEMKVSKSKEPEMSIGPPLEVNSSIKEEPPERIEPSLTKPSDETKLDSNKNKTELKDIEIETVSEAEPSLRPEKQIEIKTEPQEAPPFSEPTLLTHSEPIPTLAQVQATQLISQTTPVSTVTAPVLKSIRTVTPVVIKEELQPLPRKLKTPSPTPSNIVTVTDLLSSTPTSTVFIPLGSKQSLSSSVRSTTSTGSSSSCSSASKLPRSTSKMVLCKDREYDANKHCGVIGPDGKNCTRSLTCKTHALSLRRKVTRKKPFDTLLKEHRATKEALLAAKKAAGLLASPLGTTASKIAGIRNHTNIASIPVSTSHILNTIMKPVFHRQSSQPHLVLQQKQMTPPPEQSVHVSSDDDDADRPECSHITYHPRPIAINTFGARLHGSGCHVFNRKSDQLRGAFHSAVDRYLHPPPFKKSRPDQMAGQEVSSNASFVAQNINLAVLNKTNKMPPMKSKTQNRSKPKEQMSMSMNGNQFGGHNINLQSNVNGSHGQLRIGTKRKHSTDNISSGAATSNPSLTQFTGNINMANNANANLPISIAIPSGISLNLSSSTLSSLNANLTSTTTANNQVQIQTGKNNVNYIKDLSIVVTNIEGSVANGQLVTIPSSSLNLSNATHLQLTNIANQKPTTDSAKRQKNGTPNMTFQAPSGGMIDLANSNLLTNLANNAVILDNSNIQKISQMKGVPSNVTMTTVAMGSTAMSPPQSSPSTTPSPAFRAESVSPQVTAASPLPNGVPVSHLASHLTPHSIESSQNSAMSNSLTAGSINSGSQAINLNLQKTLKQQTLNKQLQQQQLQQQQGGGVAINLTQAQADQVLTGGTFHRVRSTGTPGQFTNIQIQPKHGSARSKTIKSHMIQPVSLTFPISQGVSGMAPPQTQSRLFIQNEDRRKCDVLQTNSPSNVIT
ncbi:unnamed protein product [Owenia fusiformis]|uniref:Uncharacterized protein n=1 Tax=Owenia fusiformis TaxID=6347 RepID=A0A8J1T679_OWEFU|nr:unnamed protein product [Owenia fusiformis]